MSKWRTRVEMFGRKSGEECSCDGREVYVPTNTVKFTRGKRVIWWMVKVPVEVAECNDELFEKIEE